MLSSKPKRTAIATATALMAAVDEPRYQMVTGLFLGFGVCNLSLGLTASGGREYK